MHRSFEHEYYIFEVAPTEVAHAEKSNKSSTGYGSK